MGRLSKLRVIDPVLTNVAHGYSNAELIGTKILPLVTVEKTAGKIPLFGTEQFKVFGAKRAIRGKSNRFDLADLDTVAYATEEYDLETPIDYLEMNDSLISLETKATNDVVAGLKLTQEKQIADLLQATGTYTGGNYETLTSGSYFDSTDVDPTEIIATKKSLVRSAIAKVPNTMVMGYSVFQKLCNHPAIIARLSNTTLGIANLSLLQQIFEIPTILVGTAVYLTDAGAIADVWGNNIVLMYNTNPTGINASVYEPAFGYTLGLKGNPYVDKYEENGGKIQVVRATDNYDLKIVGNSSGYLIQTAFTP